MPEMDGFELAKAIVANGCLTSIRRVAVTAHPLDEVECNARSSGYEAVFQKPVKITELVRWVQTAFGLVCR
jgi:CheY-like chemotaxis protein